MIILNVNKISKHFGERTLFDDISFAVDEKDKIGFIGANGAGKTTLFKIIMGEVLPDSGTVSFAAGVSAGYMRQNPSFNSEKGLFDEVVSVFDYLKEIEEELALCESEIESGNYSDRIIARQQELLKEYSHVDLIPLTLGEINKSLDTVNKCYSFLVDNKYDRKDVIIAI